MGTPHRGIKLANAVGRYSGMLQLAGLRVRNEKIMKLLSPDSESLFQLSLSFSQILRRVDLEVVSCYEKLPSGSTWLPNGGFVSPYLSRGHCV